MNRQMMCSIALGLMATSLAMSAGLTAGPVSERIALVTVEALFWGAGFMFARSLAAERTRRADEQQRTPDAGSN